MNDYTVLLKGQLEGLMSGPSGGGSVSLFTGWQTALRAVAGREKSHEAVGRTGRNVRS